MRTTLIAVALASFMGPATATAQEQAGTSQLTGVELPASSRRETRRDVIQKLTSRSDDILSAHSVRVPRAAPEILMADVDEVFSSFRRAGWTVKKHESVPDVYEVDKEKRSFLVHVLYDAGDASGNPAYPIEAFGSSHGPSDSAVAVLGTLLIRRR